MADRGPPREVTVTGDYDHKHKTVEAESCIHGLVEIQQSGSEEGHLEMMERGSLKVTT